MENRAKKTDENACGSAKLENSRKVILEGFLAKCRRYAEAVNKGNELLAEAIKSDLRRYSNIAYLIQSRR